MTDEYQNDQTADTAVSGLIDGQFIYRNATPEGDAKIVIKASLGDGYLDIRNLRTGGPFQLPHPEIPGAKIALDALAAERAISENRMVRIHKVDASVFMPEFDDDEAAAIDPYARVKQIVVRECVLRGVGGANPNLSRTITDIWREKGFKEDHGARPDTRTVRSWIGKGDPTTISVAELMSRSGKGPRARRLRPELVPIVDDAADYFYTASGLRPRDAESRMIKAVVALNKDRPADDQLKTPSRETLRKRIGEMLTKENYARKHGKVAADKNFGGSGLGLQAERIGQLGAMDDTPLDGIACFDGARGLPAGRPNLCLVVDVASRCIVGYFLSFSPPTANTAIETLKAANAYNRVPPELLATHPVLERINCRFEEIIVDRGSNYRSLAFGQALLDTGTALRFARVRRARDKAIVERIFHTLKTFLLEKLPGATFDPKLMREFGYDPQKDACLTIAELRELIEYFIAVYHLTVHSGIGVQPALFWSRSMAQHGRQLMDDAERFGILQGETIYGVQIHRWGFKLDGIRYTHPTNVDIAVNAMAGAQAVGTAEAYVDKPSDVGRTSKGRRRKSRKAGLGNTGVTANLKVKRNTANLVRVHAFVPEHGWLEYHAANAAYADGLSLHQHQQIGKWAAARNMAFTSEDEQAAARASLIERVRELMPNMSLHERNAVARMVEGGTDARQTPAEPESDPDAIAAEPCDDREDPEPTARATRGATADADGDTIAKPSTAERETERRLREMEQLGWKRNVPEDEAMEEHG